MDKEHKASILEPHCSHTSNINWKLLHEASHYYSSFFTYQETPYLIPKEYSTYTKPHCDESYILNQGLFKTQPHELVGSAEQGFIYLLLQNKLSSDKLYSISPCFRTEEYDNTHQPWFIKLELFHISDKKSDLEDMINKAMIFFKNYYCPIILEKTADNSFDLLINDIEIGSYGMRKIENTSFIYGTGLALPRFEIAIKE